MSTGIQQPQCGEDPVRSQNDLFLIFVPQWSPFQPALSVPSLSAWLKRAGLGVRSLDANVLLYEWLFSDECGERLAHLALSSSHTRSMVAVRAISLASIEIVSPLTVIGSRSLLKSIVIGPAIAVDAPSTALSPVNTSLPTAGQVLASSGSSQSPRSLPIRQFPSTQPGADSKLVWNE